MLKTLVRGEDKKCEQVSGGKTTAIKGLRKVSDPAGVLSSGFLAGEFCLDWKLGMS